MSDDLFELQPTAPDPADVPPGVRQLVLVKKGQHYVFRYDEGGEAALLSHLIDLVQRGDCDLDWFDAAVLSHQMGVRLGSKLERLKT